MRHSPLEAHSSENTSESYGDSSPEILPPVVAIGGLLTVKRLAFWYQPLLDRDDSTDLPADKRFIAPPKRGIGEPSELQKHLTELLEKAYERLDRRKLFIVGHSLGGLMGSVAGLERPDLVAGVVSLGGVHDGYSMETPGTFALRHLLGNPEEAHHLRHDSPFMHEQRERRATEWRADVPLHLVATPLDQLIVPPRGFEVQLPPNQKPEKRILITPSPFGAIEKATRWTLGIQDDVLPLSSRLLTEHLYLPRDPAVIDYAYESRAATTITPQAARQPSTTTDMLLAA